MRIRLLTSLLVGALSAASTWGQQSLHDSRSTQRGPDDASAPIQAPAVHTPTSAAPIQTPPVPIPAPAVPIQINTPPIIIPLYQPLRGFVDLHTHPLSNLGFGGKLLYGGVDVGSLLPADPNCNQTTSGHEVRATSELQALGHDASTHGGPGISFSGISNSCGDTIREQVIHNLQMQLNASDPSGDASGFQGSQPNVFDFPNWPVWNDITHQKMWVEWIRRAYTGGLRVMVALAVNNKTLGDMTAGPGDMPTDDKTSADKQIAETIAFVDRHLDFMEVAFTAADVRRIVLGNKLAVVIGVEIDHIGNFQTATWQGGVPFISPAPSDGDILAEIDRLYAEGVRYIFPIHLLDNAFGGTAAYVDLFNTSNLRESGHSWALVCADPPTNDPSATISYTYNPGGSFLLAVAEIAKLGGSFSIGPGPTCPIGAGQRNGLGLLPGGVTAIKEMMRHGMLIDIDHMSQAAADQTLALAVSFGYPVNSGHNAVRGDGSQSERALRADQYRTIGSLHGMAGVGSAGVDAFQWLAMYNHVIQAMGGGTIAAGFGTDTDGLERGMPPHPGEQDATVAGPQYQLYKNCYDACPSRPVITGKPGGMQNFPLVKDAACVAQCGREYPGQWKTVCTAYCGAGPSSVQYNSAFPASTDGNKTWNYNTDGVAHYGMLWDFLQDVQMLPGGAAMVNSSFLNGAEYFYQTWKKAELQGANVK